MNEDRMFAALAADAARAYIEPPWSVNTDARDEAKSARRDERGHYRRVGDEWVDESDLPAKGDE